MAAERKRKQDYKTTIKQDFEENAFILLYKMVEMASRTQENTTELVDEMLHSILFLGEINRPKISPGEIFPPVLLDFIKEVFPQPFKLYSSSLPRRSPFSCVLDMVVHLEGQKNEEAIKRILQELVTKLKREVSNKTLYSTTICISAGNTTDSVRHYGVSMSTTGRPANRILIAASCLNFWEEHVAHAVMSHYPVDKKIFENIDFSVNIKLPPGVRCKAFNLTSMRPKDPCNNCKEMFGLDTTEAPASEAPASEAPASEAPASEAPASEAPASEAPASEAPASEAPASEAWLYGNCAEAESLSNLLREREVREQVKRIGNCTEVNKKRLRCEVKYKLTTNLRNQKFAWDEEFYVAQRAERTERAFVMLRLVLHKVRLLKLMLKCQRLLLQIEEAPASKAPAFMLRLVLHKVRLQKLILKCKRLLLQIEEKISTMSRL